MFLVYILESIKDSTFYIGQTNNLTERLNRHNKGRVKSTKHRYPFRLVYFEKFSSRAEAMAREWEIKKKYNTQRRKKLVLSFDKDKLNLYLGL